MTPETIAHYRISSKLGEGAMGEVYRAIDSKLGREVAIKLIPDDFARDTVRMARFTREAQVLASLNHPTSPARLPMVSRQRMTRASSIAI